MTAFCSQQHWVAATETTWSVKLKIFATWPFPEFPIPAWTIKTTIMIVIAQFSFLFFLSLSLCMCIERNWLSKKYSNLLKITQQGGDGDSLIPIPTPYSFLHLQNLKGGHFFQEVCLACSPITHLLFFSTDWLSIQIELTKTKHYHLGLWRWLNVVHRFVHPKNPTPKYSW